MSRQLTEEEKAAINRLLTTSIFSPRDGMQGAESYVRHVPGTALMIRIPKLSRDIAVKEEQILLEKSNAVYDKLEKLSLDGVHHLYPYPISRQEAESFPSFHFPQYKKQINDMEEANQNLAWGLICNAVRVMEKIHGRHLQTYIGIEQRNTDSELLPKFGTWKNLALFFYSLVGAVCQLHIHGIAHLDLAPENVILPLDVAPIVDDASVRYVKLVDFGKSQLMDEKNQVIAHLANADFSAPELVIPNRSSGDDEKFSDKVSGIAADYYSLGGLLYYVIVGDSDLYGLRAHEASPCKMPPTLTAKQIKEALQKGQPLNFQFPCFQNTREGQLARDLITRLLSKDPKERSELNILTHSFLQLRFDTNVGHDQSLFLTLPPTVFSVSRSRSRRKTNYISGFIFLVTILLLIGTALGLPEWLNTPISSSGFDLGYLLAILGFAGALGIFAYGKVSSQTLTGENQPLKMTKNDFSHELTFSSEDDADSYKSLPQLD